MATRRLPPSSDGSSAAASRRSPPAGAAFVDRELVCPHCIADYLRVAFASISERAGYKGVLDDAATVLRLAGTSCDAFVQVVVVDRKTGEASITSKPEIRAGPTLCDVLRPQATVAAKAAKAAAKASWSPPGGWGPRRVTEAPAKNAAGQEPPALESVAGFLEETGWGAR